MPKVNPNIFRAYDIRGIAQQSKASSAGVDPTNKTFQPIDLTVDSVFLIGRAAATYLKREYNTQHMAVGRDVRETSPALQEAYINGLLASGLSVTDVGLATSPTMYFASCSEDLPFDAATSITASHNPKEYNGIKIVANNAHSICGDELQEVYKLIEEEDFDEPEVDEEAGVPIHAPLFDSQDIWPLYKKELLSKISDENFATATKNRPLKIVIDAGNGAAGPFAPELLEALNEKSSTNDPQTPNIEVIKLYCKPDGTFPNHEANPEELHNMKDLIEEVKAHKADLGIGFDGDGDRIGVVDEEGTHYSADYLLLLLTQDLVTRHDQPQIVFDVKVSQAIINRMTDLGATPVMSKTGHSFIEQRMKDLQALLGGEVSGHMFFGENYYGFDDAFLAMLKIIEILAQNLAGTDENSSTTSPTPFSQLFNDLPETHMTPEFKAHTPDDKKFAIVEALTNHFTEETDYECITIDGVRVKFDELSWGAVRASNTSPNLTLRFEATSPERLTEIQAEFIEELKKHPDVDLGWYEG
jgi:phosphomannomutase / phosphoglucomutase